MRAPLKRMHPTGAHLAHDRLDGGRAARAVASEQADDLARADAERHALQDVALAVIGVQVVDLKHRQRPEIGRLHRRVVADARRACRWR